MSACMVEPGSDFNLLRMSHKVCIIMLSRTGMNESHSLPWPNRGVDGNLDVVAHVQINRRNRARSLHSLGVETLMRRLHQRLA